MITKAAKSSAGIIILVIIFVLLASVYSSFFKGDSIREFDTKTAFIAISSALLGLLILPLLTIRIVFKEKLREFGWQLPEERAKAVLLTLLVIFILVPFMMLFAQWEEFQQFYLIKGASLGQFILAGIILSAVYYFAEEFLFRGFLFWGLWRNMGYNSFWVTSVIFALFHIQKPFPEIIFAFFASLLFCYLSLKTKSFIPAAAAHFGIALLLNILVNFK